MAPVSGGDCAPCPGMRLPLPNTLGLESGLKVMGAAGLAHFILSGSLQTEEYSDVWPLRARS